MTNDYESLGRYVAMQKKVDDLEADRVRLCKELIHILTPYQNMSVFISGLGGFIRPLPLDKINNIHEKILEREADIKSSVQQLNDYARKAGEKGYRMEERAH